MMTQSCNTPFTQRSAGTPRGTRPWLLGLAALLGLASTGCRWEMYDQPRYDPYEPTTFFENGQSSRMLVAGTVPRNSLANDAYRARGITGLDANGNPIEAEEYPFSIGRQDLLRGQERFNIYCAPCHGRTGDGNGMIVQRGFPPPPPLYGPVTARAGRGKWESTAVSIYNDLRDAPAGHFVRVIAEGHGVMYSYATRVEPDDRWRIAAYIRALQLSQYATPEQIANIPDPSNEERGLLQETQQ